MPEAPRASTLVLLGLFLTTTAGAPVSVAPVSRPTVEPTLPLLVDLRLEGAERSSNRARARLEIHLQAEAPLDQIELSVAPSAIVRIAADKALPSGFRLAAGERRLLVLPLEGPADRDLPIRIEAAFRTEDGRSFRLGSGVTLESSRNGAVGRSYLGAWEVMAVPLEALHP